MGSVSQYNKEDTLDPFMQSSRPSPHASSPEPEVPPSFDAYAPAQIAMRVREIGVTKATMSARRSWSGWPAYTP